MLPRIRLAGWSQNWREIFGKNFNWKNFTFINASIEWGCYKGTYFELELGLLGFNVSVEAYDPLSRSVFAADMDQKIAEAKDELGLRFFDDGGSDAKAE